MFTDERRQTKTLSMYWSATKMSGTFLNAQSAAPNVNEGWRAGSPK
jgi:hypothetical protein